LLIILGKSFISQNKRILWPRRHEPSLVNGVSANNASFGGGFSNAVQGGRRHGLKMLWPIGFALFGDWKIRSQIYL